MLFYGPVTAMFMYIALIKKREYDRFERALIWNILGISGFFLFCTLKGRVEINWTLPVIVPMLIIFMRYSDIRPVFRRRFYYGAAPVFNLWHCDDSLRFRKVAYINNYLSEGENIQNPFYRDYQVSIIDSLPVMNDIVLTVNPLKAKVRT